MKVKVFFVALFLLNFMILPSAHAKGSKASCQINDDYVSTGEYNHIIGKLYDGITNTCDAKILLGNFTIDAHIAAASDDLLERPFVYSIGGNYALDLPDKNDYSWNDFDWKVALEGMYTDVDVAPNFTVSDYKGSTVRGGVKLVGESTRFKETYLHVGLGYTVPNSRHNSTSMYADVGLKTHLHFDKLSVDFGADIGYDESHSYDFHAILSYGISYELNDKWDILFPGTTIIITEDRTVEGIRFIGLQGKW